MIEVANTVQAKLTAKNAKIDNLKARLASAETCQEKLLKEKSNWQGEKTRLEEEHRSVLIRYETLACGIKKIEAEFSQLRQKIAHYELTMEKAAAKLTESEKRNEQLAESLSKFKALITAIVYAKDKPSQQIEVVQSAPANTNSVFTESLAALVASKLKDHLTRESNSVAVAESSVESMSKTRNETNEINILKFFSGLQQRLEEEANGVFGQSEVRKIQTSSANDIGRQSGNDQIVLEADQSSIAFDGMFFIFVFVYCTRILVS